MGGGRNRVLDGTDRIDRAGVDFRQRAPRTGNLHRVDHEATRDQGLERRDVVAVAEPLLDERHVGGFCLRRCAFLVDDPARRLGEVGVAFVQHQQQVRVTGVIGAIGFDRVVQAQHRGRRAPLQDAAHRIETGGERPEGVCPAHFGGREVMRA